MSLHRNFLKTPLGRTLILVAASTALGLFFGLQTLSWASPWASYFATLINFWAWGLAFPLILRFDRQLPYTWRQPVRLLASHVAAGLLFTALYVIVVSHFEYWIGLNTWAPFSNMGMLLEWHRWSVQIYLLLLGLAKAYQFHIRHIDDELRMERLERGTVEAMLGTLRARLNPHFLFNTLNAISSNVERDPKAARRMIEHLADLLRLSLEAAHDVPLATEINVLKKYLEIEKARFGARLRVEWSIAPETLEAMVPSLLLQPVVENAIRHGFSGRIEGGRVQIAAVRNADKLELKVTDDGVGLPPDWSLKDVRGLGLSATYARVTNLSAQEGAQMTVRRAQAGGTEVFIAIPLRLKEVSPHVTAVA